MKVARCSLEETGRGNIRNNKFQEPKEGEGPGFSLGFFHDDVRGGKLIYLEMVVVQKRIQRVCVLIDGRNIKRGGNMWNPGRGFFHDR